MSAKKTYRASDVAMMILAARDEERRNYADLLNLLKEWQCFVLYGSSRRYTEREMLDWTASALAKVQS